MIDPIRHSLRRFPTAFLQFPSDSISLRCFQRTLECLASMYNVSS